MAKSPRLPTDLSADPALAPRAPLVDAAGQPFPSGADAAIPNAPLLDVADQMLRQGAEPVIGAAPLLDASGEFVPDAPPVLGTPLRPAATVLDEMEVLGRRLSPPAIDAMPRPLPPVQPFGTKGAAVSDKVVVDDAFDRPSMIARLLNHPMAEVRQRAAEAQVAIHHGAADIGIKVRAALDSARGAETRR